MFFEIKELQVHYGMAEVLKHISLTIDEGTIVALIGSNGAGKTTTLNTISGLKSPTSGEVFFRNQKIDGMPVYEIVQLGISHIPEGREVFAPMTVLDNLKMGAYLRKDKQDITKDLDNIYQHFPVLKIRRAQLAGSLSGGEQQMLAISRALMAKPKLLLMDEPSMGLSPIMVEEVGHVIDNINKSGLSIMLVEQNAHLAFELAHKAYILELGNIVLEGDSQKLVDNDLVKSAYLGV